MYNADGTKRIDTLNEDDRGWLREMVIIQGWDAMKAYGYIRPYIAEIYEEDE